MAYRSAFLPILQFRETILLVSAIAGLALGLVANALGAGGIAQVCWSIVPLAGPGEDLAEIAEALRRGDFGLDLVAALSMTAALLVGESLAANVVALMYAGAPDAGALRQGRARAEMTALLGRVPRTAMRRWRTVSRTVAIELITFPATSPWASTALVCRSMDGSPPAIPQRSIPRR